MVRVKHINHARRDQYKPNCTTLSTTVLSKRSKARAKEAFKYSTPNRTTSSHPHLYNMGRDQYVRLTFKNDNTTSSQDTLRLKFPKPQNHWGYPFQADNLDTREKISYESVEQQIIELGQSLTFGQTSAQNVWAGCSGTVELYSGQKKIARIEYACPWAGENQLRVTEKAEDWVIDEPASIPPNALDDLTYTLRKRN